MSDLVERLSNGKHPVAAEQYQDCADLKQSIERDYVLVRFTETQGGTELGFKLDKSRSELNSADFENASGTVRLAGELTLDYQRVRCIAEIDLATLQGEGQLELLESSTQATDADDLAAKESDTTIH